MIVKIRKWELSDAKDLAAALETCFMKKMNQLLNCVIGAFVGVFIGYAIYLYRNIDFYKSLSIPWYKDLYYWEIVLVAELIVCFVIKIIIRKKNPNKKDK